jgi:hypothetical protein
VNLVHSSKLNADHWTRSICVTSADGQTGHLIAELLLTDGNFTGNYAQLCCHAIDTDACKVHPTEPRLL